LVIEVNDKRIMTDPGAYSTLQSEEKNIDIILITHEHPDHYHFESLQKVLVNNPSALLVTNTAVGKLLTEAGLKYEILEDTHSAKFKGVYIEAHGDKHAFMRSNVLPPQNTGYYIDKKFFYPGDALTNPNVPVEILALPVSAPWLTIDEVLKYAQAVNPKIVFPVHDGMLNQLGIAYFVKTIPQVLEPLGINFKKLELGKEENL